MELNYAKVLSYYLDSITEETNCDFCRAPLHWFIKLKRHYGLIKMSNIALELKLSNGQLSRKLNPDVSPENRRALTANDVEQICSILKTSLSAIFFLYERKNHFGSNFSKSDFEKLIALYSDDFSGIPGQSVLSYNPQPGKTSFSGALDKQQAEILSPFLGTWYVYFPGSDSSIISKRQKLITTKNCTIPTKPELRELYDLYSSDHIYAGIFTISIEQRPSVTFRYLSNPQNGIYYSYTGSLTPSGNARVLFASLHNKENDDFIYMIIDYRSGDRECPYPTASFLYLSHNYEEKRRRPCSARMIMSRDRIPVDSPAYRVMTSNLMMNDGVIRIDDQGFAELKNHQKEYNSPALDQFLKEYENISDIKKKSNYYHTEQCAYIQETVLDQFSAKGLSPRDSLYLEALIRLHSTAPWYAKTNSQKANLVMKEFAEKDKDSQE